jgi:protein TIF31
MTLESFEVKIKFEKSPDFQLFVFETTSIMEMKRVLNENLHQQVTCYSLYFNDFELKDFSLLNEIPSFMESKEKILNFKSKPYNGLEQRIHVNKLREITSIFKPNGLGIDQTCSLVAAVDPCIGGAEVDRSKIECYLDICLSSWNPVPFSRKLKGDIYYYRIITLEKKTLEITGCSKGFFVNKSTAFNFNPTCSGQVFPTLYELMSHYSLGFKQNYDVIVAQLKGVHPYEYLMTVSKTLPWQVKSDLKSHTGRSLDEAFNSLEQAETISCRDWNDDIQSAKELPRESGQERVERDQALFRAHSDFIDAAIKGVELIVDKCIPPINPMEEELSQMYVHNNMFFSEGYDNKQIEQYGGKDASHVAISKDIDGIKLVESFGFDDIHTLGTVMIDYRGHRIVVQSIVPGILKNAASQESSVLYGSVDGGNEILSDNSFDEISSKLANMLFLKKHSLCDQGNAEHKLNTSVETKWVNGSDSRKYCLDLYRAFPVDATFLEMCQAESTTNPYPHEMVLLRTELLELFFDHKYRLALKEHDGKYKSDEIPKFDSESFRNSMRYNPDVFTKCKLGGSSEEIEADKNHVREVSGFIDVVISQMIVEMVKYPSSVPIETKGLTRLFHSRGVNMRYLGKVLSLSEKIDNSNGHFQLLLKEEIVSRCVKRIIRDVLIDCTIEHVGDVISNILNGLFAITKKGHKVKGKEHPSSLKSNIIKMAKSRFRYDLSSDGEWNCFTKTLLRSICLKVGIQIESRDYKLNDPDFTANDILNIYPIVKDTCPLSLFASEAHEHGKLSIGQDKKDVGFDLIRESISIFEQVCGPVHAETGKAYSNLALLYFNEKEVEKALDVQRRALICTERTRGVDDPETLKQYVRLS